jgi:hypothetical protein
MFNLMIGIGAAQASAIGIVTGVGIFLAGEAGKHRAEFLGEDGALMEARNDFYRVRAQVFNEPGREISAFEIRQVWYAAKDYFQKLVIVGKHKPLPTKSYFDIRAWTLTQHIDEKGNADPTITSGIKLSAEPGSALKYSPASLTMDQGDIMVMRNEAPEFTSLDTQAVERTELIFKPEASSSHLWLEEQEGENFLDKIPEQLLDDILQAYFNHGTTVTDNDGQTLQFQTVSELKDAFHFTQAHVFSGTSVDQQQKPTVYSGDRPRNEAFGQGLTVGVTAGVRLAGEFRCTPGDHEITVPLTVDIYLYMSQGKGGLELESTVYADSIEYSNDQGGVGFSTDRKGAPDFEQPLSALFKAAKAKK